MSRPSRLVACAVLPASALLIGGFGWGRVSGSDVWQHLGLRKPAAVEASNARLDATATTLQAQRRIRDDILAGLIDGQVTLADGAGYYLDLRKNDSLYLTALRNRFPNGSDSERVAQDLLELALNRTADADNPDEVRARLKGELRAMGGATALAVASRE